MGWTGGRVVEGTALEMRRTCKRTVGSNPTLSATPSLRDRSRRHSTENIDRFKGLGPAVATVTAMCLNS